MHLLRRRKLPIGFAIISLLMTVIAFYAYCIPEQQKQQAQWVTHTHEVLSRLDTLSSHLMQAETGQQGYLLTGQAIYRRSYSDVLPQIDSDITSVQQLTLDNAIQQAEIPTLREHAAARIASLQKAVDLRRSRSAGTALPPLFSGRGSRQQAVVQRQIDRMRAQEQGLRRLRIEKLYAAAVQTRWIFMSGVMLLYTMLGVVYRVMQKEAGHRKRLLEIERAATHLQREEAMRLSIVVAIQRDIACLRQDLQTTMQTITERTQEITDAEGGVVEVIEGDEMVYRAVSGSLTAHLSLRLKVATSLSGRCVRENAIFRCDDAESDDRVDKAACRKVAVRSMVVVPLRSAGQAIGALKVVSGKPNTFTEQDVATLELLAGVLSAAMNDAAVSQALRDSQKRLEEAQQVAHIGSWELDIATQKLTWSNELFRLVGRDPAHGEPDYDANLAMFTSDSADRLNAYVLRAVQKGLGYAIDLEQACTGTGAPRWHHAVGKPVLDAQGKVIRLVGTLLDITERKNHLRQMQTANERLVDANSLLETQIAQISEQSVELEAQKAELEASNIRFEALASTDGLTGLKNHRAFQERIADEIERAARYKKSFSVILADVDHFKSFNDTFGHPAGDTVLTKVAETLQCIARSTDLAARYGGEEFVLVLPETDAQSAVRTAERIRHAIAERAWDRRDVTVSIGVATFPQQAHTTHALIDMADKALYYSKDHGRNRVTHADELLPIFLGLNEEHVPLQSKIFHELSASPR